MAENASLFDALIRYNGPVGELLFGIALSSLRLYAAFAVLPALGEKFLPGSTRTGLVVMLAAVVAGGIPARALVDLDAAWMLVYAFKETMIGFALGFAASKVFWVAECVGALIDTQAGYNNVQLTNPQSGQSSTPVSSLLLQLMVVVFFMTGGMLAFIEILFASYKLWPVFSPLPVAPKLPELYILKDIDFIMTSIVKFAAPMLLVLLLVDLGIGFVTRAADKLEPSNLSQPIKGAMTILMLALAVSILVSQVRSFLVPRGVLEQLQSSLAGK